MNTFNYSQIENVLNVWCTDPKSIVLLTGAGLSVSADVSLWPEIKKDLYKDLFDLDDPNRVENEYLYGKFSDAEWLEDNVLTGNEKKYSQKVANKIKELKNKGEALPPELVLSFFKKQYSIIELQNFLARHYETSRISVSYISLIRLAKLGLLKFYITLNQDGLFEKYLESNTSHVNFLSLITQEDFNSAVREVEMTSIDSSSTFEERFIERKRLMIGNLHGVFYKPLTLELSPMVLIKSLFKTDARYKFLKTVLSFCKTLIVIGYRAADLDILGAIEKILKDKKEIEIIWVNPKGEIPRNILASKNLQNIKKYGLSSTADDFLSCLAGKASKMKLSFSIAIPINKEGCKLICSAPGSLIVMGDYGVYINGKMIQVQIPLRVRAYRYMKGVGILDSSSYFDPYTGVWLPEGSETINKVRQMIKDIKDGQYDKWENKTVLTSYGKIKIYPSGFPDQIRIMLNEIREEILKRNLNCDNFSITAFSEFPPGSGAGDTLPYVIIAALLLQNNDKEVKLEQLDDEDKTFFIKFSKIYTWLYTYSNASHLRILPTFWNKSPLFILDRSNTETEAFNNLAINPTKNFNTSEYMQMNLLIDTESIFKTGKEIEWTKNDRDSHDFIIAYYPRRAILSETIREIEAKTTTARGVYAVNYEKEKPILEGLANLTDAMIDSISNKDYIRIGKIMSAGHFGLVSLLRGSRLVNELVGLLSGLRGIFGAKTSGGGPGGALLVAYNPKEMADLKLEKFNEILSLLESYHHQILLDKVFQ